MKLKMAPDSKSHVVQLAVIAGVSAALTVVAANVSELNLGAWSALVSSVITIALSILKNIERS